MKQLFLEQFLDLVSFKHTRYTIDNYTKNPNKNNLFGVVQTLRDLGIRCSGYRISEEKDFCDLKYPIISVLNDRFIVILSGNERVIQYKDGKNSYIIDTPKFVQNWTGKVVEIENIDSHQEINYKSHRLRELLNTVSSIALYTFILSSFFVLGYLSHFWESLNSVVLLIIYLIGACIASLSYFEYLDVRSVFVKNMCSVLPNSYCSGIISGKSHKVLKIFHLSEIALSFFVVSIISIVIFNCNTKALSIYSIVSLPVCIWSLIYQTFVIHRWCTFCISIVAVSITLLAFYAMNGYYSINDISVSFLYLLEIGIVGVSYLIFAIIINKISSFYKTNRYYIHEVADYEGLKFNPIVFKTLLRDGKNLNSRPPAPLVFGDKSSDLVLTIVSNLYCASCVANHNHVRKLIKSNFRIEYVFTSVSEDLLEIHSRFIAFYNKYGSNATWDLLSKWYSSRNHMNESFFAQHQIAVGKNEKQMAIAQLEWINSENISVTPSNYLNGSKIPSIYRLSELQYLNLSI